MTTLVLSICFIFILSLSFYFNDKNKDNLKSTNIFFTIVDALIVSIILYLTFLNGFIFALVTLFIIAFVLLILMYIRVQNGNLINDNFDLKFEAFKNTLIIFMLTFYPFFISLTVFRYFVWPIQILLSIGVVFLVLYGEKYFKVWLEDFIDYWKFKINFDGARKFIYVWTIIGITAILVFIFNFPTQQVNNVLNLNNHRPIFNFVNGYDVDIMTNYEADLLGEYESITTIVNAYEGLPNEAVIEGNDGNVDIRDIQVFYDYEKNITYTAYVEGVKQTVYIKTYPDGTTEEYTIKGIHNTSGYVSGDIIYLTGGLQSNQEVIEIMDGEFKINGIYNLQPTIPFFENNRMDYFQFIGCKIEDGKLVYTTHEEKDGVHYYKDYSLSEIDVDIHMPFYSHYSMGHVLFILVFMFIPITDYKKHITVIDFDSQFKQKDD